MKKGLTRKNKKGFTLIELVVVIAILGILAAILIPVIGGFIERANRAADLANARNLFNSASIYVATEKLSTTTAADGGVEAAVSPEMIDLRSPTTTADWDVTFVLVGDAVTVQSARFGVATYSSNGNVSYS